ncbi:acyltransferase-domain-containing protein [Catenaria anguillulae PL171]|uniref:Acyltransferase-domain-containing protein n=1 Tax=Catenaria anguillulae PL171 TaxID=765915 RepID=A0A1Y2HXB6_9FUNG|nr:acyltransferase-domain-containing protein [Catenaria anguillulae PL171]
MGPPNSQSPPPSASNGHSTVSPAMLAAPPSSSGSGTGSRLPPTSAAMKPKAVSPNLVVIPKVSTKPSHRKFKHKENSSKKNTQTPASLPSSRPETTDDDGETVDELSDAPDASAAGNATDLANLADSKGLGRFRNDPFRFMIRLSAEGSAFWFGSGGWRKYNHYIGAKILHPGYTQEILKAVYASPHVQEVLTKTVADQVRAGRERDVVEREVRAKVKAYANALVADLSSKNTLRFIAFVVNNLLVRMYHQGIYIKGAEWIRLRNAAKAAEEKGISLLFLPCHKSHVDYLVISYIFYRLGIALPHIAAGQNLNIPVIGSLLKKGGAFFIRRSFGNDPMYSAVFKAYLETLLMRGHNVEAFIEGARSRTGKLLPPKFGVLKVVLEAVRAGRVKDVMIVPMSIGYDKVIETASYVSELLGRPKEPESLGQLVSSTSILQLKFGRIDVRFAEPFSLRTWLDAETTARTAGTGPLAGPAAVTMPLLLRALGYRVLSEINSVAVVMPSALVGTVILTLRGRGVGRTDLINKVDWLRQQIISKGGKVAEFGDPTPVIVDRVLALLGADLIGERRDLLEPVYFVKKRFELSLYRNQCLHHFVNEAIMCASIEVAMREIKVQVAGGGQGPFAGFVGAGSHSWSSPVSGASETSKDGSTTGDGHVGTVSYHQLLRDVTFLSQLFKREFVYPHGGILENMNKTIKSLVSNTVLESINRIAHREKFDFYCFLIWPFVETYWLAGVALLLLDDTRSWEDEADRYDTQGNPIPPDSASPHHRSKVPEDDPIVAPQSPTWYLDATYTNQVQELAKVLYYEGELTYFESINKEILKNAWNAFAESGMIEYTTNPALRVPHTATSLPAPPPPAKPSSASAPTPGMGGLHIRLSRDWHPAKNDRLVHFLATLHRFRRDKDGVLRYAARAGLTSRIRRLVVAAASGGGLKEAAFQEPKPMQFQQYQHQPPAESLKVDAGEAEGGSESEDQDQTEDVVTVPDRVPVGPIGIGIGLPDTKL